MIPFAQRYTVTAAGCWEWHDRRNRDGYGMLWWEGRNRAAHIVTWELTHGPVPAGRVLDHGCRNRACCNPAHLEPVTQKVNVHRGVSPAAIFVVREACNAGHPYTPDSTYLRRDGGRRCRVCEAERQRIKAYGRRRAAKPQGGGDA